MKKLIELIKKLLGLGGSSSDSSDSSDSSSSSSSSSSSGFTLVELLIVIAIIGILAAGLLLAIDPAEKIRQSSDTRAVNDVTQTASKIEQWTITTGQGGVPGVYPNSQAAAFTAVGTPTPPNSNYVYAYAVDVPNNTFYLTVSTLRSKKYPAPNNIFKYDSERGKTCLVAAVATDCP